MTFLMIAASGSLALIAFPSCQSNMGIEGLYITAVGT